MTDRARRRLFIQDRSNRVFETTLPINHVRYGKVFAISGPVGCLNMIEDFARRATGQRSTSQRTISDARQSHFGVKQEGHLSVG